MLKCWSEQPLRRPKYEDLIEDLEGQISEVSGIDYLDLQPPIIGYVHESVSSGRSASCSSDNSAPVFETEDDSPNQTRRQQEQAKLLSDRSDGTWKLLE